MLGKPHSQQKWVQFRNVYPLFDARLPLGNDRNLTAGGEIELREFC